MTYINFINLMENDLKGKELFRKYHYAREALALSIANLPHVTFSGRLENETIDRLEEFFQACVDELKRFTYSYGLNSIEFRNLIAYLEK